MFSLRSRFYRFLRWSERYTKTDMVYLASGGFWSTLAQVVTAVSVLSFAMLVSRYLPKAVYGEYKYVLAIIALLGTLSLNGLSGAVFQSVARGFDGALHEGFWANIRWSALVFLGALAFAVYYFLSGNDTLALGMLIGGSFSPFLASANLSGTFLQAKKDFARSAIYFGIIETLLSVGALIVTIFFTHSVLVLVAVYFLSNTLATLWLYRRVTRLYAPDPAKTDPGMLTYGKHLSLMGILGGIAGNIDQVLLFHFVGPAQLAVYNFAVAIPDQAKGPIKGLDKMVQTKFVNRSEKEIRAGMHNKILWTFISAAFLIACYIFAAPFIYKLLFPRYFVAVFYSQLYALSYLADSLNSATSYLVAKRKVREQYISNISLSIFRIIAVFTGVVYWGLLGIVIARIIVRISGMSVNYFLYAFVAKQPDIV